MNQRVEQLKKQAEKFVLDIPASLDINEFTAIFNEKFAELIVRECARVADQAEPYQSSDLILKHFGVIHE